MTRRASRAQFDRLDRLCDLINVELLGKVDSYAKGDPIPDRMTNPAAHAAYKLGLMYISSPDGRNDRYSLRDGNTYSVGNACDQLMRQLYIGHGAGFWSLDAFTPHGRLSLLDVKYGDEIPMSPADVRAHLELIAPKSSLR